MLVLSRHRDEVIRIGDDVTITIVDIRGDKVRVGIEAPSKVSVHRQEVYEAIQREREAKSDASGVRLHGNSERVVGGEKENAERAASESAGGV